MELKDRWDDVSKAVDKNRDINLGTYYSYAIDHDIKHLGFVFARYKFASKLLDNRNNIKLLELGCNYGIGTKFFQQNPACGKIVGVDFDAQAIKYAKNNFSDKSTMFIEDNFLNKDYTKTVSDKFDAIISLDVIEHIDKIYEKDLLNTIDMNLSDTGIAIIGTPNVTMEPYASESSRLGHINLYNQQRLYELFNSLFNNVFIFGMNDEIIHTGFYPMSCYIFALCCGKK